MISFQYMGRRSAIFTGFWRAILTCGLCLLAFLFAVEAKTAWYGPVAGLGSNVRASKAMPADAPHIIDHGVPTPDPVHPLVSFLLLPALALLYAAANRPRRAEVAGIRLRPSLSAFSSHLFRRPPPALS